MYPSENGFRRINIKIPLLRSPFISGVSARRDINCRETESLERMPDLRHFFQTYNLKFKIYRMPPCGGRSGGGTNHGFVPKNG